jgi:sugar lactone lactonase YvrE
MESMKYEAIATGFGLLEAPRIDDNGVVYFSDITGGGVFRVAPGGKPENVISTDRKSVGGMAFTEDGGLIVSGPSVAYWDSKSGKLTDILKTYPGKVTHGFNDLTVDRDGSVFVGSTNPKPGKRPDGLGNTDPGDVYRIDASGKASVVWEGGLDLSNGMGFSPDGNTLYHVDAFAKVIFAYDVAPDRRLKNQRIFARFEEGWGWPDGMAVDAQGGVWAPALFGGMLIRFGTDGRVDRQFEAPTKKPVTLVFGGRDLRDLVVVCAKGGGQSGTVYKTRTDIPGLPVPKSKIKRPS